MAMQLAVWCALWCLAQGARKIQRQRSRTTVEAEARKEAESQGLLPPQGPSIRQFPKCFLANSSCSIQNMTEATLVYTDDPKSVCWNGDPYAFIVRPGAPDKLLTYFAFGGACWDNNATNKIKGPLDTGYCFKSLREGVIGTSYGWGVMNFENENNKFRNHTLVSMPYCTGGVFIANVSRRVVNFGTGMQYDYLNAKLPLDWTKREFAGTELESFVLMGASSGALGLLAWSDNLLSSFSYKKASVIMDSYIGIFPEGTEGKVLNTWGACTTPLFRAYPKQIYNDCVEGKPVIHDIMDYTIKKHKDVAFAHIEPKADLIQIGYYGAVGRSYRLGLSASLLSPRRFYASVNNVIARYNRNPNYVVFVVGGAFATTEHCYMPYAKWYITSTVGYRFITRGDAVELPAWTWKVANHEPVESACRGERTSDTERIPAYCDERLFPKQLFTVGDEADEVEVGDKADEVEVGEKADEVEVGDTADEVEVGDKADEVEAQGYLAWILRLFR